MKELKKLFENNQNWIVKKTKKDPKYFSKLYRLQKPKYLWIGCSDSRILPNEILGLEARELFIHRNIANLFLPTDMNCLAVLEFAVDFLKIKHVIVCGHYCCGGVKSAIYDKRKRIIDYWLYSVRDIYARHKKKIEAIKDVEKQIDLLAELNVKQQVINICHTPIVQKTWKRKKSLFVHGLIYDLKTGRLKDLNFSFSKSNQVENIYHV